MQRHIFWIISIFLTALSYGTGHAQTVSYEAQLLQAQFDLKKVCVKYDKDKQVFDRVEIKRKANLKLQSDLGDKINEASVKKRHQLIDLRFEQNLTPEQFNARVAQIRQNTDDQIAQLREQRKKAIQIEWTEFGEPYREVRESFEISKILKERAVNTLEKLKKNKPGKIIGTDGRERAPGPGDDGDFDREIERFEDIIDRLKKLREPSSPNYVDRRALKKLEKKLDRSTGRTEEITQATDRFGASDPRDLVVLEGGDGPGSGFTDDSPFAVDLDIQLSSEVFDMPDHDIGVVNLGVDNSALHRFSKAVVGPGGRIGFDIRQKRPGTHGGHLFGRIGAGFAIFDRTEGQTIPGFSAGQAPTYIDITGGNGFAFNNNSIVSMDVDVTRYGLKGEAGWEKQIGPKLAVIPYAGAFLRRTEIDYDVTMDTDFNNGRFFNTLNERLRLNQLGADVGLDVTYMPGNRVALTVGGHAGLVYTDTSYTGSDCGDGSILTSGCDGALFSNTGVSRDRSSVDPFAGLKAAVGIYFFCRAHSTEIAASLITNAAEALKNHCAQVSAQGSFDIMPTTQIDRPTAIGATGVQLSTAYVPAGAFSLRARIPLGR